MSNTGNMGMGNMGMGNMGMGNMGMGNMGSNGGSGGGLFADRVHLPFVSALFPSGNPITAPPVDIARFPVRNWASEYYAWLVLTQFVVDPAWASLDKKNILPVWLVLDGNGSPNWNSKESEQSVTGELNELVVAARDERADAFDEIVAQHDEFASYFLNLLSASNGNPATAKLLTIASFIAGFCGMYYKGKYQRPRPTMLCPALLPPLCVPGHASFPSGHSTQAHLMALCVGQALPKAKSKAMADSLTKLADRIARNREIAGLHYASDSAFGRDLAPGILELLSAPLKTDTPVADKTEPAKTWYQLALEAAQEEWK
jgi:membrane-associated phospholipid phosphatase